jgi:hypothetical protein
MLQVSPFKQFVAGFSIGLIICFALWFPSTRELLVVLAVARRQKVSLAEDGARTATDRDILRLGHGLIGFSYLWLGGATATTVALFLASRH